MERFGYQPLVRPLGVMPDAVFWTQRDGMLRLALTEAKASTRQDPHRLLEQNVFQFLVDINGNKSLYSMPLMEQTHGPAFVRSDPWQVYSIHL